MPLIPRTIEWQELRENTSKLPHKNSENISENGMILVSFSFFVCFVYFVVKNHFGEGRTAKMRVGPPLPVSILIGAITK